MRALTLKKTSEDHDELIGKISFNFEETEIKGLDDMQKIVGGIIYRSCMTMVFLSTAMMKGNCRGYIPRLSSRKMAKQ